MLFWDIVLRREKEFTTERIQSSAKSALPAQNEFWIAPRRLGR